MTEKSKDGNNKTNHAYYKIRGQSMKIYGSPYELRLSSQELERMLKLCAGLNTDNHLTKEQKVKIKEIIHYLRCDHCNITIEELEEAFVNYYENGSESSTIDLLKLLGELHEITHKELCRFIEEESDKRMNEIKENKPTELIPNNHAIAESLKSVFQSLDTLGISSKELEDVFVLCSKLRTGKFTDAQIEKMGSIIRCLNVRNDDTLSVTVLKKAFEIHCHNKTLSSTKYFLELCRNLKDNISFANSTSEKVTYDTAKARGKLDGIDNKINSTHPETPEFLSTEDYDKAIVLCSKINTFKKVTSDQKRKILEIHSVLGYANKHKDVTLKDLKKECKNYLLTESFENKKKFLKLCGELRDMTNGPSPVKVETVKPSSEKKEDKESSAKDPVQPLSENAKHLIAKMKLSYEIRDNSLNEVEFNKVLVFCSKLHTGIFTDNQIEKILEIFFKLDYSYEKENLTIVDLHHKCLKYFQHKTLKEIKKFVILCRELKDILDKESDQTAITNHQTELEEYAEYLELESAKHEFEEKLTAPQRERLDKLNKMKCDYTLNNKQYDAIDKAKAKSLSDRKDYAELQGVKKKFNQADPLRDPNKSKWTDGISKTYLDKPQTEHTFGRWLRNQPDKPQTEMEKNLIANRKLKEDSEKDILSDIKKVQLPTQDIYEWEIICKELGIIQLVNATDPEILGYLKVCEQTNSLPERVATVHGNIVYLTKELPSTFKKIKG